MAFGQVKVARKSKKLLQCTTLRLANSNLINSNPAGPTLIAAITIIIIIAMHQVLATQDSTGRQLVASQSSVNDYKIVECGTDHIRTIGHA